MGVVTLRFLDRSGGMKLRINKLFPTQEDAEAHIASIKKKREEDALRQAQQKNDSHTI